MARVGATGRAQAVADRSPAHTLRMAAEREGAELIVIGSSHLAGAERILSGDDTAATLHRAPGAVAVAVAPRDSRACPACCDASASASTARRSRASHWRSRAASPIDGRPGPRHHGRARADAAVAQAGHGPRVVRS